MHFFISVSNLFSWRSISATLALVGLLLTAPIAHAVILENQSGVTNLMPDMMIHVDPTGHQSLEDIRKLPAQAFTKPKDTFGNALNLGFTNDSYWVKLTLQRVTDSPNEWILEIPYLGLDQIDFYAPGKAPVITGASRSIDSRALFNRYFVFPIEVNTTPQEYYFRFQSSYAMTIPLSIYERTDFAETAQKTLIVQFLYFGGILALILYNLQLYISLRDKSYLFYTLFGLFIGLGIFAGNGFGRILLWPDWPRWDQISQSALISIGGGFSVLFGRDFLRTRRFMPRLDVCLKILAAAYFVIAAGLLYATVKGAALSLLYKALMVLTLPYFTLIAVAAVRVIRKGHASAKFYLIAWAFLCTGAVIATLRAVDWIPTNVLTAYAIQIGAGLEMLFLSYALAYRIQSERARREFAQNEALDAKNAMVEVLRASEEKLETLVIERTSQLEASLANEKKLHEQYVRFSAMISHEFRNPLNNIQAQTDLLEREKKLGIDQFDRRLGVISSAIQQLALLFDRWMQSDRIKNELALRNVQRIQTNEWVRDLVERYQASAYQHPILFEAARTNAEVTADDTLLQIAVINLLDNACKYSADKTSITVRIVIEAQHIGIEVKDEGEGIDPAHHCDIFEEHFRVNTAHPRRGTGLGLAFVKRIAELHQGKVTVVSALGYGATFTLWLPR